MRTGLITVGVTAVLIALMPGDLLASPGSAHSDARTASGARHLTIFYTGEIHGTLEPCGCTSDPLGDLARYASLVRSAARSGPILLIDGGGLSYPESSSAKEKMANGLRARFLGRTLRER